MISCLAERVTRPAGGVLGRGVGGHRQLGAARRHVPRHPGAEPGRPARRLPGEDPRRPGLARPPPPGARRIQGEHLIGGRFPDPGELVRGQLVLRRAAARTTRGPSTPRERQPGRRPGRTAGPATPPAPPRSSGRGPARRDPHPARGLGEPVPKAWATSVRQKYCSSNMIPYNGWNCQLLIIFRIEIRMWLMRLRKRTRLNGPYWLARRRTSRSVREACADHKVRASSSTSETDGEWLEPVVISARAPLPTDQCSP